MTTTGRDEPGAELAVRDDGAVAEVVDAELVPPAKPVPVTIIGTTVRPGAVAAREMARTHPRAAKTLRAAVTTGQGWASWGRRAGQAATHGVLREQVRVTRARGDREALTAAIDQLQKSKDARARRLKELPGTVYGLLKASTVGLALLGLALVALGLAVQLTPGGWGWSDWWGALGWLVTTAGSLLYLAVVVALWVAGPVLAWAGWKEGDRVGGEPPRWLQRDEPSDRDVVPDEGAILAALRNLGYPALDKRIKEGWTPRWVQATGRDGKGWRTQLELPPQVTVEGINDRKKVLAHNLVRLPVEVWVMEPKRQPGVMDLWVADQGLLTGPVEPYPLLHEGTSDYFRGVVAGIDQRGDRIVGKLMASNYAIAGTMGSGKTSLVIELLCGAMLDPLVDVEVFVMAFNVDYDPLRPRLARLVKGDEDEHVVAAMDRLRELRGEVTKRGKILAELGGDETKVTRALAEQDPRLRPKVVVVDECQELFRHDEHGDEAKELAIKVMMKARKCAITLLFVTPAPSADSLPRDLAKTASHRVCFAIGDHQGNDAILGTGAHRAGITATTLVPGEDVGTAMASGFGSKPGLIRTHHIRKDKTVDELTPIVRRAVELLDGRAAAALSARDPDLPVDYLADVLVVIGDRPRVHTVELLAGLARLDPSTYGGWDTKRLKAETGLGGGKSNGTPVIRRVEVAALIAARGGEAGEPDEG